MSNIIIENAKTYIFSEFSKEGTKFIKIIKKILNSIASIVFLLVCVSAESETKISVLIMMLIFSATIFYITGNLEKNDK